jgi:hypothetical protein
VVPPKEVRRRKPRTAEVLKGGRDDSQAQFRGISIVFTSSRSEKRSATQSWDVQVSSCCRKARTCRAVLQAPRLNVTT